MIRVALIVLVTCLAGCQPLIKSGFRKPAPSAVSNAAPAKATQRNEELIFTRFEGGTLRILSRSMDSGSEREIYVAPRWAFIDSAPTPDGRWLMVLEWNDHWNQVDGGYQGRVHVYDRVTGNSFEATSNDERVFAPVWIDNSHLALLKDDSSCEVIEVPSLRRSRSSSVGGGEIRSERDIEATRVVKLLSIHDGENDVSAHTRLLAAADKDAGLLSLSRGELRSESQSNPDLSAVANSFDCLQYPQRWQLFGRHIGSLTYVTQPECKPSWNRKLLAYSAVAKSPSKSEGPGASFEVGVWDARRKAIASSQVLPSGGAYDLHWAQDNRRFIYTRDLDFAQKSAKKELWLYDAAAGEQRLLCKGENGYIVPPISNPSRRDLDEATSNKSARK